MSKINDLQPYQRPREKAILNGISSLSDKELLAIFIRCGTKDFSALDIANNMLEKYDSLTNVCNLDIFDLLKIKGIKKAKAVEISAIMELAKRVNNETNNKIISIKDSDDVYRLFKSELENEDQEYFIVLFLNIKLSIIKKETLFIGGDTSALIDINFLFKKALKCGAKKLICIHNHPSGDPFPSKHDVSLTQNIRKISEITNIELLDHIIIGKNDYFSFSKMQV